MVVIETPRRQTEALEFSNAFRCSVGGLQRKKKDRIFSQEKSGKSQEILEIRFCDNSGNCRAQNLRKPIEVLKM